MGDKIVKTVVTKTSQLFEHPRPIGDSYYTHPIDKVEQFKNGGINNITNTSTQ